MGLSSLDLSPKPVPDLSLFESRPAGRALRIVFTTQCVESGTDSGGVIRAVAIKTTAAGDADI